MDDDEFDSYGARTRGAAAVRAPANTTSVPVRGLENPAKSYNCFLNVILQALWFHRATRDFLLNGGDQQQHHRVLQRDIHFLILA